MLLALLTLLHFLVDGLCGAVLAAYALAEPNLAPIVRYFGLYSAVAFGTQWLAGAVLDWRGSWTRWAFLASAAALAAGTLPALGILAQALLLGAGNSVFHAAGGRIVLLRSRTYSGPGVFVSSGAVGLALGLNSLVGAGVFLAGCALAALAVFALLGREGARGAECPAAGPSGPPPAAALGCMVLLLSCVVLRGMGSGEAASPWLMLFPCTLAAGKALGGLVCDRAGYRRTILLIFLLSFAALMLPGLAGTVLLVVAFSMTMPLTLRLAHWCSPGTPGLVFGLAAGCLLPGLWLHGFAVPPHAMAVLQFLCLAAAGAILARGSRDGEPAGRFGGGDGA